MSGRRARVLLVLLVSLVGTGLPWTAPTMTSATTARVAAATGPATVTVDSIDPAVVTDGSELRVVGRLANTGAQDLRDVEVRLRLSDTRLNSRAELAAVAEGRTASRDGEVVVARSLADLAMGQTAVFDLTRPVDELAALTEFGVYVLGIEVLATRSSGFGRVAIVRTLLPWVPATAEIAPTGFSWLWPLVAAPSRLADGAFADDSLAREMAPGGRLARLVEAGARLGEGADLTWVVDPELIAAAEDMVDAGGYRVRGADGDLVPGGGSELAAGWLEALRAATAGERVLGLPYGDADLTAVTRAGLAGDVPRAREQGQVAITRELPAAEAVPDTAWPVDGFVNRETLAALRRAGVATVVLDGRAVPTEIELSYTPSGRAHVSTRSGRVAGVLAEPGLADLLRARGKDPLLAAQRFLAETAMITSELPSIGTERTIVVTPPRRWDPDPAYLARLADVASRAPWMAPVPLAQLADSEPPEVDRASLQYPAQARRRELPASYLRAIAGMQTSIDVFAAVLTDRTRFVPGLNRSVLLLESSWWRGRQARANRLHRERDYLTDLRARVRIQPGNFTFSSRRGTIPLTVANELPQEVLVDVRLDPQTPRLRIEDIEPQPVGPRTKRQVEVPATAVAGGPVVVDASLRTPGGAAYGQPVQLRVTITEYGTVALYITVAAAAVLFLAAGVRVLRRLLGARRAAS